MYDVIVIGAGPSGSRVALRMAENGFSTAVIDKKAYLDDPVCCTGIVGCECIEHYSIPDEVIYRNASGASVFSPSMKLLHIERSQPQAAVLDRPAFNRYLAGQAIGKGAEYMLSANVTGIRKTSESVVVETDAGDSLETKALVIADGFGSKLAQMMGFTRVPDLAMGAQAVVSADGLEEVEVCLGSEIAPGFFGWLVPTEPGKALAGLMSRRNTADHMKKFLAQLKERRKIADHEIEISYAGVALKQVKKASGDRVLVVGSAAGQVKPITGGGIYYGMRCADLAADTLRIAFEAGDLTETTLSNYDKKWKQLLDREINIGYWSRRFYERLNDKNVDRLFNIIQSRGVDRILLESDDLRFDWHGAVILKLLNIRTLGGIIGRSVNPFQTRK